MTDLQLSLIIIGGVAVAGVYLFNRIQERRYRREAERVFGTPARDVLMEKASAPKSSEHSVPGSAPATTQGSDDAAVEKPLYVEPTLGLEHQSKLDAFEFSPQIDYVVTLAGDQLVSGRQLREAVDRFRYTGKPVRWRGRTSRSSAWQEVSGPTQTVYELQVGLQLANRGGPATELDIASFVGMVKNVAAELHMKAEFPNQPDALRRAQGLDQLCAAVDLLIGINVVSSDGAPFPATKIRALAEAEGMALGGDGVFYHRSDGAEALFSLTNQEPRPFLPDQIKGMSTSGITLVFDVPRVKDGARAFDKMVAIARSFAHALHGIVVDDNRQPLFDPEVKRIKTQLEEIYTLLADHGIPGGSAAAARLFSE